MPLSRRRLLIGAGAVAVVGAAGGVGVNRLLVDDVGAAGVIPDVEPGRMQTGTLDSRARGVASGWALSMPPGNHQDLPVVVVLHGRGNDHASSFGDYLGLDRFQAQAVERGARPFAVASIDGGETYWHPRDSGEDAGAMVLDEFLPLLAEHGCSVDRIALMGWSMGGYGALRLAGVLGPDRCAGVAAMSPALWHDHADTAPGAFDDEADFVEATVMGRQQDLAGIRVRIDCGRSDPFLGATEAYVEGFSTRPAGRFEPGAHDRAYWRRVAPDQLSFVTADLR